MPWDATMSAIQVDHFGGPDVMRLVEIATPSPGANEALVQVDAAGVGPWDGWVRSGQSVLDQPLPLTPGSEVAGLVVAVGASVTHLGVGDRVFGATNGRFTNGYARYAACEAERLALCPRNLSAIEAASCPVVAVTAWQMLFEAGRARTDQTVLIHGALGSVGRYAVQFARNAGLRVWATARPNEIAIAQALGIEEVFERVEAAGRRADLVLDLVGGPDQGRLFEALKRGGSLVSAVAKPDPVLALERGVTADFILVDVRLPILRKIAEAFETGDLAPFLGPVLPLAEAVRAHRIMAGELPRAPGKIVLTP